MAEVVGMKESPWLGSLASIAAQTRGNIVEMSRQAEEAVTRPRDPGAFSSSWRLAVSARIAALNGQGGLADHYRAKIAETELQAIADPAFPGRDDPERAVLAFMDKVAADTKAVVAEDIAGLKAAGIAEADIVRLCELNAFMGYQVRVLAGLAVLKGASA